MSEEVTILGGSPAVTFEDAVEFLSQRANNACSACGHNSWHVTAPVFAGSSSAAMGLSGVNLKTGETVARGVPTIFCTCKKCAHIRLHGIYEISRWVKDGKPEFIENE